MALTGVVPDAVIVLAVTVSLTFPVEEPVPKTIVPEAAPVSAPLIVQFWTVLLDASPLNRIVAADAVALVLSNVSALPPLLRPSIVTWVAPFRSTSTPATLPESVQAPPTGEIAIPV